MCYVWAGSVHWYSITLPSTASWVGVAQRSARVYSVVRCHTATVSSQLSIQESLLFTCAALILVQWSNHTITKSSCFYMQLVPSPRKAASLWGVCNLQMQPAASVHPTLVSLIDVPSGPCRAWFSGVSAPSLVERGKDMLDLVLRSLFRSLVDGQPNCPWETGIRKNGALKKWKEKVRLE